jgi:hypothetical protein
MGRMIVVTTRTWVHACNQGKAARKGVGVFCPADGDFTVFKGLTKRFKYATRKLGKLVKKKHSVMCQTYLSWHEIRAASNQSDIRNCMMRRSERTLTDERGITMKLSRYAVNLCRFEGFLKRERW